jgi:hypothetical protein
MFFDKFFDGMATIGQLFPAVPPGAADTGPASAWGGVAASFLRAGDNIRAALKEFSKYQYRPAK